jgi:hypothetical protein
MFNTRWQAKTFAIVGYIPDVSYPGMETTLKPPTGIYYASAKIIPSGEKQSTFRSNVDGLQNVRYNNFGILQFVIFCPISDAQNAYKGRLLGIVARDAFTGKESPSGVRFFSAVLTEPRVTEVFNKFTVNIDYNYDDVRSST